MPLKSIPNSNFYNVVAAVFKQIVGFLNLGEGVSMGYQRGCVNLTLGYKSKYLDAIATIHATGLKYQIFAIHVRQRQHLRLIIESHNRYNGIWSSSLPSQLESVIRSRNLNHAVSTTMFRKM